MKPSVPSVPLPVWSDLYAVTERFRALHPWEVLDDLDPVAVRDPATGATGYGIVMGSGGTMFGCCFYRGAEGFNIYRGLLEGLSTHGVDDEFALQNCLLLEFGARSDLQSADLAVIRQLGLSFRGNNAWPGFRSLLPGYAPWFLNEAEATLLTLGLRAICAHCESVIRGEIDESLRKGECLSYTPTGDPRAEFKVQWEPWPPRVQQNPSQPTLNLTRINALLEAKTTSAGAWEAEVFYLPSPIMEGDRPYYTRMGVVCQQSSGVVLTAEVSTPDLSGSQVLVDAICSSIEMTKLRPDTIVVKDANVAAALGPLGKILGFTIRQQKKLTAIRTFRKDIMKRFGFGGGGKR
jgi:hypothetical protein